jgi:hypothetical protein
MQIKVYTIDVRFPRWLKRAIVFGAIPVARACRASGKRLPNGEEWGQLHTLHF